MKVDMPLNKETKADNNYWIVQLYGFKYSYLILIIFKTGLLPIDKTQTGTTTLKQHKPDSNGLVWFLCLMAYQPL